MVDDFLVRYSFDICTLAAMVMGVVIGALVAYEYGQEKGYMDGFDLGYALGKIAKPKRDDKGRFTK